jgi:hypothetical protein
MISYLFKKENPTEELSVMPTSPASSIAPQSPNENTFTTLKVLERVFHPAAGPEDRALAGIIRTMAKYIVPGIPVIADGDLALLLAVSAALVQKKP